LHNEDEVEFSSFESIKENVFINCIKNPLSDILYSINSNRLIPEPHQYKPLTKFLNSENNRLLIADEVGLGKTIEAGMIYKELSCREDLKISLIVVPTSLTLKWQEELYIRFDENFDILKTNQFLAVIDEFDNFNLIKSIEKKIIINYHTIRDESVIERLRDSTFEVDFLIMDEVHYFRNESTSTFVGAQSLTAIADNILFLSATPVQNDIKDLFNVLILLDSEYFMDFEYFKKMIEPNKAIHKVNALLRNNHSLEEIRKAIFEAFFENSEVEKISTLDEILNQDSISIEDRIHFIDKLTKADHLSFIINRTKKKDVGRSLPRNAKSVIVDITDVEKDFYEAVIEFVKFIHPNMPQGFITIMPERMASSSMLGSYESFKVMKQSGKLFINGIEDIDEFYDAIDIRADAIEYLNRILEKGKLIGKYDSKFLKFIEIVESLQSRGIKQLIVFSFFKHTLNYLMDKLLEFKIQGRDYPW
jgi:SNF2 family DNA or RNA helicase